MKFNKIGIAAVILCVLLLSQGSSSFSASMNTSDSLPLVSSEPIDIASVENTIPIIPQNLGTVVIVVENSLYYSISAAVTQYRQDLNDTGYHTILYNASISTAEQLKANLSTWYDSENILGAVLIGRLPYAEFYHPAGNGFSAETFICDLFLTDLDGTWSDTNPSDGIYDAHSSTTGTDSSFPSSFLTNFRIL